MSSIQSGVFEVRDSNKWATTTEGGKYTYEYITVIPGHKLVVALVGLDHHGSYVRVNVEVELYNGETYRVRVSTWADSEIVMAKFTYIAYSN